MRGLRPWLGLVWLLVILAVHACLAFQPWSALASPGIGILAAVHLEDLSAIIGQVWSLDVALLSAVLVALFFGLNSLQAADPTRTGLSRLIRMLGLSQILGLLTGGILGTSLTFASLRLADPSSDTNVAGLKVLAILDFLVLDAAVIGVLYLVVRAVRFVRPQEMRELNSAEAYKLGRATGRGYRIPGFQRASNQLDELMTDAKSAIHLALERDDEPRFRAGLEVFASALAGLLPTNQQGIGTWCTRSPSRKPDLILASSDHRSRPVSRSILLNL